MYRNYIMVAFCLTVITACSSSTTQVIEGLEVEESDFQHYRCDDDKQFDVAYVSSRHAILKTSESYYRLATVPSGSGSKYILDDRTAAVENPITLFTKGSNARLEVKGLIYRTCHIV